MKLLFSSILFILATACHAQVCRIYGTVEDAASGRPIPDATISTKVNGQTIFVVADTLAGYTLTVPYGSNYLLKVSHLNYKGVSKLIHVDNDDIEIHFRLTPRTNELGEVVVRANALGQANDTTIYYTSAYKTNEDATAYDLISQKLPGIVVRDGKLEAQGETVKEVLLDGQEFFKSDITLALKNLPADIVSQIQLFDQASDYSQMTGFDDGSRRKVINLVTKTNMKKNIVGKAYAGYGIDDYYQAYGMLNWFNNNQRLSFFLQDNNISEQDFSMIDLLTTSGTGMNAAPQQSPYDKGSSDNTFHPSTSSDISELMVGGYTYGETTSRAVGVNYSDKWGKDEQVVLSGHYVFNNAKNEADYDIQDDYYDEETNTSLQQQRVNTDNSNHRFNAKISWNVNENAQMTWRPSFLYQRQDETASMEISEEDRLTGNLSQLMEQDQQTKQEAYSTSHELMYIHRFGQSGRSVSFDAKISYDNTEEELDLQLNNLADFSDTRQHTWSNNTSTGFAAVGSYIQNIGKNWQVKVDAGWSITYRDIKRNTQLSQDAELALAVDSALSGKTSSDYGGFLAGGVIVYSHRHLKLAGGTEYHAYRMNNRNDITNRNTPTGVWLPFMQMRWQWGARKNNQFLVHYKTEQTFPSTQQLQDAINNTNPTLSIRGNIGLKPANTHSIAMRMLLPSTSTGRLFVFFANIDVTQDYIASKRSTAGGALGAAEQRSQMLSYVNSNGYYSTTTLVAYGFPLNFLGSNINLTSLFRFLQIPGYWESEKSYNRQIKWDTGITIGSTKSEAFDFVIDCQAKYLNDKNESHPLLDVDYWTLSYGGQLKWRIGQKWTIMTECGQTRYFGLDTHEMDAVIWNTFLSYKFLKKRSGEIKLSLDDIFNQNNNFNLQTNELFRRKTVSNIIGRHMLLTFTYNLNN